MLSSAQALTSRLQPTATTSLPIAESSSDDQSGGHELTEERGAWESFMHEHQHTVEYFVAGGLAGATSRTAVSPFERLKILMQVQSGSGGKHYTGIRSGLLQMWREEGFRGYMKGNGINVLRIFPYSAVQFTTYESVKSYLASLDHKGTGQLGTPSKLLAGSLAGITSVCSTYPLDLVRARISISDARRSASAGKSRSRDAGLVGTTLKVYREEGGLRGLYRGCIPTAAGVAPFVALNFAFYERFRFYALPSELEESATEGRIVATKLAAGALAGGLSQTLTYPFDVIRRKMQVVGMQRSSLSSSSPSSSPLPKPSKAIPSSFTSRSMTSTPATLLLSPSARSSSSAASSTPAYTYTSGSGALVQIFKHEGMKGLYRGIGPNLLKVAPSMGVSFYTYETVLSLIRTEDD